jgi:hypothetical protein
MNKFHTTTKFQLDAAIASSSDATLSNGTCHNVAPVHTAVSVA